MIPAISAITVTYNPRPDLLNWALDSLAAQTLPAAGFEVIVVDNNSQPPLDEAAVRGSRGLNLRVIREPRQGNAFARATGIAAARGSLLVFLDDDNHFDPDYLEQARAIALREPHIGCFGGIARAFLEAPLAPWKQALLPYLGVRDYGPEPITSHNPDWGEWEPIGAGMVFRKDVGECYVDWVSRESEARSLGRKGKALMSGEDCLIAQAAYRLGYACSYQPALRMEHCMKLRRLQPRILAGTILGHGRSFVLLQRLRGHPVVRPGLPQAVRELARRYPHRVKAKGFRAGTIEWCWDLGYFQQARRRA